MSTITNNVPEPETDAILTAFAQAKDTAGGADLAEWMTRHPGCARDLARLAAEDWAGGDGGAPVSAAAVARVRSIGLATLRACRPAAAALQPAAAPLTSLLAAAKSAGWTADSLSAQLELPVALFWKLHRRLIAPDSVPRSLTAAIAAAVNRTLDDIAAYLRTPPQLAAGASYRSDDAPQVGEQETFAEALRNEPDATDAQCRRWLSAASSGDGA